MPPRPGERRRLLPGSLAVRISLLAVAAAVVVALVAGLVGAALIRNASVSATRKILADQANIVAAQLAPIPAAEKLDIRHLADALATQGIDVVLLTRTDRATGKASAVAVAERAGVRDMPADGRLSTQVVSGERTMLVEARAVNGRTVALVAPADLGAAQQQTLERRILIALLIGLAVAVAGAVMLALLLAMPLRRTAAVARSMAAGERSARAAEAGPTEVADVARSVNELADTLAASEARQRAFFASVSHELRTPLAGISGQADALADGLVPTAEVPAVGSSIRGEAARLERLVTDLLDLARLGADSFRLDLAPVDVSALLRQAEQPWRARCEARSVPLVLELPAGAVTVITDARRLRQVVDGLAENALRLLGPGRPLVFAAREQAGCAVLQVRDGGPGLAAQDYPVAFQPGVLHDRYRHQRPSGAGLGLALAHGLVTRMGGTIEAGPAAEGGVAMTITLPAVPGGAPGRGPMPGDTFLMPGSAHA